METTHFQNHSRESLLSNAELLLKTEDPHLAKHLFSYLLKQNIRDTDALRGLATSLYASGLNQEARRCFSALYKMTQDEMIKVEIARCYTQAKQLPEALMLLQSIQINTIASEHSRAVVYRELAQLYCKFEKWQLAEAAYQRALKLKPRCPELLTSLATLEHHRGQLELAAHFFKQAIEIDRNSIKSYIGLGLLYLTLNDKEEAKRQFNKALTIDENSLLPLIQLSFLCEKKADIQLLIKKVEQQLQTKPKNLELRFALSSLLFQMRDWSRSEVELNKILQLVPEHPKARNLKEQILNHRSIHF